MKLPSSLPVTRRTLLTVLVGVLVIAGVFFGYTNRALEARDAGAGEVVKAKERLSRLTAEAEAAQRGDTQPVKSLLEEAKAADAVLPAKVEEKALVATVPLVAERSGVALTTFNPGAPVTGKPGAAYVPFATTFTGSYEEVVSFLTAVRGAGPFITVANPTVTVGGDAGEWSLTLELRAWYASTPPICAAQACTESVKSPGPPGAPSWPAAKPPVTVPPAQTG